MKTVEKQSVFRSVFSTGSHGASGQCHCGIFHFDTANEWDDDHHENVLPAAEQSAETHPELYQFQDTAIEYVDFNGRLYVLDCRCAMDSFVFELLNEEKQNVLSYYKLTQDKISVSDLE